MNFLLSALPEPYTVFRPIVDVMPAIPVLHGAVHDTLLQSNLEQTCVVAAFTGDDSLAQSSFEYRG